MAEVNVFCSTSFIFSCLGLLHLLNLAIALVTTILTGISSCWNSGTLMSAGIMSMLLSIFVLIFFSINAEEACPGFAWMLSVGITAIFTGIICFIGWALEADCAVKLKRANGATYGEAVAATIFGVILMFMLSGLAAIHLIKGGLRCSSNPGVRVEGGGRVETRVETIKSSSITSSKNTQSNN